MSKLFRGFHGSQKIRHSNWSCKLTNISAAKADIEVVTSIKPVHSLVSGVMAGVGVPSLIIDGAGSPHTYSLKPSQAQQLQDAKLVFWMGDELETFLAGPIENIAQSATTIKLIDAHDLKKIKFRKGGMFDDHGHDDHDEHDHESTMKSTMNMITKSMMNMITKSTMSMIMTKSMMNMIRKSMTIMAIMMGTMTMVTGSLTPMFG